MATFDLVAELPIEVESYSLRGLFQETSSEFVRHSTVIELYGAGETGIGEDVTYDTPDQEKLQVAGAYLPLAGKYTLREFSDHLGSLELFPEPAEREPSYNYRRWAFESAALDLGLRQSGTSLAKALHKTPRPVTFVSSLRLGEPPSIEPIKERLALYPALKFKLDPTSSWTPELVQELVATDAVDSVDLKGLYHGSLVDQAADPVLYRLVAEGLPNAWIEDPALDAATDEILRPHRDRITWDAPIHSVADIKALPFPPRTLNFKPSRFGPVKSLLDAYDYCQEQNIAIYGGGQFEIGPGRGQIQYLASILYPDGPNDVAPGGYNDPHPAAGLPTSPLQALVGDVGFRWE